MLAGEMGRKPLTYGRLVNAEVLNSRENVFEIGSQDVLAVIDGHVVLGESGYTIDRAAGTIQLARRPAFDVKLLVS